MDFGKNFYWGAATAAYQIEGAKDADGKSEWGKRRYRLRALRSAGGRSRSYGGIGNKRLSLLARMDENPARRHGADQREGRGVLRQADRRSAEKGHNAFRNAISLGFAAESASEGRIFEPRYRRMVRGIRRSRGKALRRQSEKFHHHQRTAMRARLRLQAGHPCAGAEVFFKRTAPRPA